MQKLTQRCRVVVVGLLGGLLLMSGWGSVAYADHFAAENVSITKHNLAANSNILFGSSTAGSSEVCVFCHTPHGAGYGNLLSIGMAPLWNRVINTGTAYTTYAAANSPHFEATSSATLTAGGGIKGVSLACLSCHDGTIAFDALINLQGSGGLQALNLNVIGVSGSVLPGQHALADTLFGAMTGEAVDGDHSFEIAIRGNATGLGPFAGSLYLNDTLDASGGLGAAPFPNLTVDLQDDHPISFEIPCTTTLDGCDPQFAEMVAGSVVDANSRLLYLTRNTPDAGAGIFPADKRDRLRAYASEGVSVTTTDGATNAYIECASCHNPHTPRTLFLRLPSNVASTGAFSEILAPLVSGGGSANATAAGITSGTFWSHAPNQASAICISCHQK